MDPETDPSNPPVINYILSFLLVGVAWGFTTPFIRRAAADFAARQQQNQQQDDNNNNNNISINSNENVPLTPVTPEYTDEARPEEGGEESEEDNPPPATHQEQQQQQQQPAWMQQNQQKPPSWLRKKITTLFWTVVNLLRTPAYSIPLVVNLTGSVWFFLLVGKHELSLTVPLANSSAFLFTVLGEWYVERKVIERETWLGMALVLGGIALCVMA
ncbi:hypothetical protein M752DRAFT_278301 [Aspergillus phoenicis ATCC 13157]|uniref:Integral membrane protein n=1 Tax=Aspergillus phoenicis ATCC 13157 TaxID=1353007 RepID=A0A370PAS5_ASPPH|nr:hypothetical protein CBS147346_2653 [Aspergillus niger]RDK39291.1 hypothetical protein M752DRAFT_278301 [Aspergillus phoenicis ATCC 13157]